MQLPESRTLRSQPPPPEQLPDTESLRLSRAMPEWTKPTPLSGQRRASGLWALHSDYKTARPRHSARRTCCRRKFRSCPGTIKTDWLFVKNRPAKFMERRAGTSGSPPATFGVAISRRTPTIAIRKSGGCPVQAPLGWAPGNTSSLFHLQFQRIHTDLRGYTCFGSASAVAHPEKGE